MKKRYFTKLRRVALIYTVTALAVLSIVSALFYSRLADYRTSTRYSYELSFEQTAAAVSALSDTLEKCRYATGDMCFSLASEAFAEACAAKSALSTLPFSTVELEQTKSFLGTAGDFIHGICSGGAREFSDDVRADVTALSDTAAQFSAMLLDMRSALSCGNMEMDCRENRVENVLPAAATRLLSAGFADMEESFPALAQLRSYTAPSAAAGTQYADADGAKAAVSKLLGVSKDVLREECSYSDGSVGLSRGSMFIRADASRIISMSDSRLVSSSGVSDKRAAAKAGEFLRTLGLGEMRESGRRNNGNVLYLSYLAADGDALCTDCSAEVGIALDNCSVYSYRAPDGDAATGAEWLLDADAAAAALPQQLSVLGSRKLICGGVPCYEFSCTDGEREIKICVDAEYGRQLSIEVSR